MTIDELRVLVPSRPRGEPCAITFEGDHVPAFVGEPIAVSLFAAGTRVLARSPKFHRPRGVFCLNGHCASCLLRVDGRPNIRACMTPARPGLVCERQNAFPSGDLDLLEAADWLFPGGMDHHTLMTRNRAANKLFTSVVRQMGGSGTLPDAPAPGMGPATVARVDVCVVGGGAAGLAAATAIARRARHARVLLIDDQAELGGSWLAEPAGAARADAAITHARAAGVRLLASAGAIGFFPEDEPGDGAAMTNEDAAADAANAPATAADGRDLIPGTLAVATPDGLLRVGARRYVYATGAYEQNLPFLDNDRPGILAARACGRLAFRYGVKPGRRVAVVGDAPYGARLADALLAAGVRVERADARTEPPVAARGASVLAGVDVSRAGGGTRRIRADVIAVAAVPAPASELARQHGAAVQLDPARGGFAVIVDGAFCTSAPGVYACGDVTGYNGPDAAAEAGAAAGAIVADRLADRLADGLADRLREGRAEPLADSPTSS